MLSHQILVKLCNHAPVQVLSSLELLVEPLDKTVNKKVKDSQVGTEVERANDLIRSGLRAIVAVVAIEEETAGNAHKFLERLQKKEKLAAMLQAIDAESLAVHTPAFVRVKRLFAKLLATPAAAALLAPPPPSATRGPLSS